MDIPRWLNDNQGIIAVAAIVIGVFVALWIYKRQSKHPSGDHTQGNNASPFIKAGGNISAGGNILVGNHQTTIHGVRQSVPEFHLQLYGDGAKLSFDGHVEKKTDITLVIEFIEINGIRTDISRQFTKLTHLNGLNHDPSLFQVTTPSISIKVRYRTLTGETFDYIVDAEQQSRADGKFNIAIIDAPSIKPVTVLSKEELELVGEALKNDNQIHRMLVDQIPEGWVRIGSKDYYLENDQTLATTYLGALNNLVQSGYVTHKSGNLYLLTAKAQNLS